MGKTINDDDRLTTTWYCQHCKKDTIHELIFFHNYLTEESIRHHKFPERNVWKCTMCGKTKPEPEYVT